jgi:hypothetical protein
MLVLVGTIPVDTLPLTHGRVKYLGDKLTIGDFTLEGQYVTLGTAAMISAASVTAQALGTEDPYAYVIGDTGMGEGTVKLLKHLTEELPNLDATVMTLHYILPTRDTFINMVEAAYKKEKRPFLIADAGALLNARRSRWPRSLTCSPTDPGELSFLADPDAAHPAYVQHFIFDVDQT